MRGRGGQRSEFTSIRVAAGPKCFSGEARELGYAVIAGTTSAHPACEASDGSRGPHVGQAVGPTRRNRSDRDRYVAFFTSAACPA